MSPLRRQGFRCGGGPQNVAQDEVWVVLPRGPIVELLLGQRVVTDRGIGHDDQWLVVLDEGGHGLREGLDVANRFDDGDEVRGQDMLLGNGF